MIAPDTRYASTRSGNRVAYQVLGDGPRDLVHTFGLHSQVDVILEDPSTLRYLKRLASFSRVVLFDSRGSGLSDPRPADGRPLVEHWCEDLLAVLDAVSAPAPALMGYSEAGPLMLSFVNAHPERCSRLILFNSTARYTAAPDYRIGSSPQQIKDFEEFFRGTWGQEKWVSWYFPSLRSNPPLLRWVAKWCRTQAPPGTALANLREITPIDVRSVLPKIRVPTLAMSRTANRMVPASHGRFLAEHIPGARFVELPGADGLPMWETTDEILDLVEEFVTGSRHGGEPERVLATVLFTDIVDSTRQAAELGDAAWRQLLDRHDRVTRDQIGLHHGRLVDSAGDGTLATFTTPDQAIECALVIRRALKELGVDIRTGLHTGSVELREDGRIGGLAVHIGARLMALANGGEVLVSHTVQGILIGSRYLFEERGVHDLKGVPGKWPAYSVSTGSRSS